jgi:hypothetical protein
MWIPAFSETPAGKIEKEKKEECKKKIIYDYTSTVSLILS